jgi:hypothetical protein
MRLEGIPLTYKSYPIVNTAIGGVEEKVGERMRR